MGRLLRFLFYAVLVRLVVLVVLGLNVRHRERLPHDGPALIVANHNSHLDTMVLITLLPLHLLSRIRPVAAMDYFLKNKWLAWFAVEVVGILPLARERKQPGQDVLADVHAALDRGDILIFFPEGTRGEPEQMQSFKSGIARVAERHPDVPVVPVFLHGLGKALPKGSLLPVPFFCDVMVGLPLSWTGDRPGYMAELDSSMRSLAEEGHFAQWE
ncbi:MAG: lysophospholipid acyltransferase family protein [Rhodocyclaceae bacterium]